MKHLIEYMEAAQSEAFEKHGAFFAFSNKQFSEKKKDGVEYENVGAGLICPKEATQALVDELEGIYKDSIAKDIKENGIDGIILRELNNHEAFYTGRIDETMDALEAYNITQEDIYKVYKKYKANKYKQNT